MKEMITTSAYFGMVISVGSYCAGVWLRKKTGLQILNPLLIAVILVIITLKIVGVDYHSYEKSARYLSYFLTPATVCLAIPLYKQLTLLKNHARAVLGGILTGVLSSAASIFLLSKLFQLSNQHYVTLLPKSITTAIGMGISEEAGGIVSLTVASIVLTGIFGNVIAEKVFQIAAIHHPIAKGVSLGTASHAIGTAKALELGEIEGAMSSLSIAVSGLMTVILVPLISGFI